MTIRKDLQTVVRYIEKRDNVQYINEKVGFIHGRCDNCELVDNCEDSGHLPCILYKYKGS